MTLRWSVAVWLAFAAPAALLAAGWTRAALGERDARRAEAAARARAVAEAVAAAVDESLEELRARHDALPAGAFAPMYVPDDVFAAADAVAYSPLRRGPGDPRLLGHAQVQPGDTVETPYDADGAGQVADEARAAAVRAALRAPPLRALRALAYARPGAGGSGVGPTSWPPSTPSGDISLSAHRPVTQAVVQMNPLSNALFQEVAQARAGDLSAQRRQLARAGVRPVRYRRATLSWAEQIAQYHEDIGDSALWPAGLGLREPNPGQHARLDPGGSSAAPGPGRAPVDAGPNLNPGQVEAGRDVPRWGPSPIDGNRDPGGPDDAAAVGGVVGSVPGGRGAGGRGEATSDEVIWYTPFRWVEAGAALALVRVVSHGGASTAQVALVDRAHLDGRWLPAVVARHAGGAGATLVAPEAAAGCGLTAPVSRLLSRPLLCFQPPAATTLDRRLALEGALVLGLALALLAAAGLVVRASRRAAALARERADFVASVSHELRTPLTTLRMNAELLRDDLVPPDKRARTADAIVAESVRLGRLVENVLETTRLEGGRRPLRAVDLDLAAAVRDLLRAHEPLCAQRGFSVDVQTPDAPVPARADPEALALIVANLVENAVKYGGGDDARTIRVSVEPASSADQGPALVVEDGGPGVPAAEHERIFERFHRVDRPDRAHVAGTGLGLALVRDLARAHGGDATAEPGALGRGLRVRVRFGRLGPGAQRQSSVTSGVRR